MKKILLLLFLLVVIAGGVFAVSMLRKGGDQTIEVQSAPVELMKIVQTVEATGRIQPRTQVNISADVSAKIIRLDVKEGEWVEKGQFLLELDRERYLAAVESSEANLRATESNVDLAAENMEKAGKDYLRSKNLFDEALESQAQLDSMYAASQAEKARHQSSMDQVGQARAILKQAMDDLSKTTIYAPMSGTISQLNKEQGEIALGSQFQEDVIMVISNLSGMEALVDVDENDIVSVSIGDLSSIEVDALPGVELSGEVTEIANSAKISGSGSADQKTEFEVKIAISDSANRLRPGMTASAEIVTDEQEQTLGVPIQSVAVRTPEQLTKPVENGPESEASDAEEYAPDKDGFVEIVFVVEEGIAQARQVETGIQGETHIQIISGLSEGDEVVIGNYRAISRDLENGSAVTAGSEEASQPETGS